MTGISIFGNMSVGVRRITTGARIRMSRATTMKVYVRFMASLTIHIFGPARRPHAGCQASCKHLAKVAGSRFQQIQ